MPLRRLIALWLLVLTGCGTVPAQQAPGSAALEASGSPAVDVSASAVQEAPALAGVEAAEECGFPDGTALSFAGRSTTATLNVQEVVGDPMSFDPADIYVTSDRLEWGDWGRVRLVCAVFVDHPGFVEITVHPEDGGRFFVTPPPPPASPPPGGISREEAVEIARNAIADAQEWEVGVAMSGPLGAIDTLWESNDWSRDLSADLWVWRVFLLNGDRGAEVFIDFVDGSVYQVSPGIVG